MNKLVQSAWVIGRRDFAATVFSRTFILFLLAPVALFAISMWIGQAAGRGDAEATRPSVAVIADDATAEALGRARERLVAVLGPSEVPELRAVAPERDVEAQARRLVADKELNHNAVFSGTLERPVLTGPERVDASVGPRFGLVLEEARRLSAGGDAAPPEIARIVTEEAAGTLNTIRHALARFAQVLIFFVTLMLSTVLVSNLVEEKSSKVIEILAAAVPLDAIFLGKLAAMLAISLVGITLWGALLAAGFGLFQAVQDFVPLPPVTPGVGWPTFAALLLLYYTANYMLLGALFLGIGGQASSFREVQTLSMPITFLQLLVFLLATAAVGKEGDWLAWAAYVFPLSSPLAMIALAAKSETLWPHLLALAWQAVWVVAIIRLSSAMFRRTVLKSGGKRRPRFRFGRGRGRERAAEA